MYSEEDITAAISAGVLDRETANNFRAFIAKQKNVHVVDEEQFRLLTSFNDIFVVIASSLLLFSALWLGGKVLGSLLLALISWLLAEFFTLKRRMALPSILYLLCFVGGVFSIALTLGPLASSALSLVATGVHWQRFRVPITISIAASAGAVLFLSLLNSLSFDVMKHLSPILFFLGMMIFMYAMWWDFKDKTRVTFRADVAFWLHLVAALLIVHPVFISLKIQSAHVSFYQALIVLALYSAIGIVSLAIDRRALMVSALGYVIYTFAALWQQFGELHYDAMGYSITMLIIGSGLLILSAYWQTCRAFVLKLLPTKLCEGLPNAQ